MSRASDLPEPSYNIAPTDRARDRARLGQDGAARRGDWRRRAGASFRRGRRTPKIGARAFNARAEELEDKPMFRTALEKRRAVVPASGYYEWKNVDGVEDPALHPPAEGAAAVPGGLVRVVARQDEGDDDPERWLLSFTILTRDSIGHLGSIHDRMPLFLDPDHADAWLDPTTDNVRDVLDAGDRRGPGAG